ncbi:phytanoyl-CoA dioxygenase family protein [Halococcus qingdaonensis]|uniref:phytanoyl-CoA dioxygenase family protein n=1 Tax=Halococcus qingdaonensis TaxID=224402 RepID=UPI002116B649|nr:phytanoyl-CoA dioxygenase family protein [Halococcus qingdaonensis]
MPITDEEFERYQRNGYLVVEDVLAPDEVESVTQRLRQYVRGERAEDEFSGCV